MEGLRKSEKFMSEYKLSIFLILAMLAMLFFTAGMKTDAAEVPNGLVVNNGVISSDPFLYASSLNFFSIT